MFIRVQYGVSQVLFRFVYQMRRFFRDLKGVSQRYAEGKLQGGR